MLAIASDEKLFPRKMDARRFYDMVTSTSALSHGQITALENRVRFLEEIRELAKALRLLRSPSLNQQYVEQMKSEMGVLQTWFGCARSPSTGCPSSRLMTPTEKQRGSI